MIASTDHVIELLDINNAPSALQLLQACHLETRDILDDRSVFFCVRSEGRLVGVIGLVLHDMIGLVRSMAVDPAVRGHGLAYGLYDHLQAFAEARGLKALFLLTETAERFFHFKGFQRIARDQAPPAVAATPQFTALCPVSAALRRLQLHASERTS
jgi:amino-acid N-acetyltransferase